MSRQFPSDFHCEQCGAILSELSEAWRADAAKISSSGRDPVEVRHQWLSADDRQFHELCEMHYTRSIEARRKKTEHEILTGHNVIAHGWRGLRRW